VTADRLTPQHTQITTVGATITHLPGLKLQICIVSCMFKSLQSWSIGRWEHPYLAWSCQVAVTLPPCSMPNGETTESGSRRLHGAYYVTLQGRRIVGHHCDEYQARARIRAILLAGGITKRSKVASWTWAGSLGDDQVRLGISDLVSCASSAMIIDHMGTG
jgi:hypothetical protein